MSKKRFSIIVILLLVSLLYFSGKLGVGPLLDVLADTNYGGGNIYNLPAISITTTPNPSALSGPGFVTYTYLVQNTGAITITDVKVTDNSCYLVSFVAGDVNNDSKLDTNEKWTYHCTTLISQTTTNLANVAGFASDVNVQNTAQSTVVVTSPVQPAPPASSPIFTPKLPNTGIEPTNSHGDQYLLYTK